MQFDGTEESGQAILKWMGFEGEGDAMDHYDQVRQDLVFGNQLEFENLGGANRAYKDQWVVYIDGDFRVFSNTKFKKEFDLK